VGNLPNLTLVRDLGVPRLSLHVMLHFTESDFVVVSNLPAGANLITDGHLGEVRPIEQGVDLQRSQRAGDSGTGEVNGKGRTASNQREGGKGDDIMKINPYQDRCINDESGFSARRFRFAGCEAKPGKARAKTSAPKTDTRGRCTVFKSADRFACHSRRRL
jgi:hypothetical protein